MELQICSRNISIYILSQSDAGKVIFDQNMSFSVQMCILASLHWFSFKSRITFKIIVITWRSEWPLTALSHAAVTSGYGEMNALNASFHSPGVYTHTTADHSVLSSLSQFELGPHSVRPANVTWCYKATVTITRLITVIRTVLTLAQQSVVS